ncbi:PREDICTED: putative wall-associated receptor kinase-like 16 isoform X2 [Ipomoea nil]|uniref:putative wall-associated receptor kinase-like 16 isoform X2 n=1 Tax=Ipomoea nil TaxID=35883 RepID=UPI00090105EF|nr:PREDICTED: putative wall-associated receptor kinase-like 16 isoform X2 [Ipomoea nil]
MSFLVVVLVLSAVLSFASTATSKSDYPIAKPNCVDHCGNVSIPFPFGLTQDCSINSDFFINCTTSIDGSPMPLLGHSNIRVRRISVEGQLIVMKLIAKNCDQVNTPQADTSWIKLSKMYVNQTANKFVAVGCNTTATFWGEDNEWSYQTGCKATCNRLEDVANGTCSGIGCCQMNNIPIVARNVNFTSKTMATNADGNITNCSYAFVVKKDEFNFSSDMLTQEWQKEKRMPMVIDWVIFNDTCSNSGSTCQGNTTCVPFEGPDYGYRCACDKGYEGNPYLHPGCLDIDECEKGKNNCSENAICENKLGGFSCHCKEGYEEDGEGGCQLPSKHKKNVNVIVLSVSLGTIMLLITSFCLYLGYRRRKSVQIKEKFFRENGGFILQQRIAQGGVSSGTTRIFTAEELKKATNNYDQARIIGQGGFGIVYKGHLLDGRIVAVKKAKMMDPTQVEQFVNEVIVLSQINHRNIVKLFGCCLETEIPLLVYEFISNGTLSEHLHNKEKASKLPWLTRLKIASETAEVLSYLHSAASPPIIHRDVKPANILLDSDYTAKVSDFGASRLVLQDQTQLITMVQGTWGYLDPEYMQTHQLTEKSDVYSFGVVLVELLTGRRAVFYDGPEEERNLSLHFLSSLKANRLSMILDDNVVCEGNTEELQEVALLAKRCLNVKGEDRPTMKEVAVELGGLRRVAKHPWINNNSETSMESDALLINPPIPFEYDVTFSITTTEYDSLKHHMKLPVAAGR